LSSGGIASNIISGPDHNLWFTEEVTSGMSVVNKIGRISPRGVITEFALPAGSSNGFNTPSGITAHSDGKLWFTDSANNAIGSITMTGVISEFVLPTPQSGPSNITSGPDGTVWFAELGLNGQTGKIGRFTM
jgi:virginiamycin B lyase